MTYNPDIHHRRSIRLKGYDYTSSGWYFVTICVQGGQCVLGEVVDGEMVLNDWGEIVVKWIVWLEEQYEYVVLDTWCVMPNHVHMVIVLTDIADGSRRGGSRTAPTGGGVLRPELGQRPIGDVVYAVAKVVVAVERQYLTATLW